MALTRVSRHIIDEPLELQNINATGIGTFASLRVTGDLQVDGTTTTLDTVVTEVDRLEIGANNSTVGVAITQSGTGDIFNLYDGSTEVFTVTDGGKVGIEAPNPSGNLNISYLQVGKGQVSSDHSLYNYNTSFTNNAYQNGNGTFAHITNRAVGVINIQDNVLTFSNGPGGTAGQSATLTERLRISSDGKIGIGTDDPHSILHISSGTSGDATLILEADTDNSDERDNPKILFRQDGRLNLGSIGMNLTNSSSVGPSNELYVAASSADAAIVLATGTSNGYTNATERLRITGDGKVKIPDNGKFVAGFGDDLQIYHNGTHSYIDHVTSGALIIRNTSDDVDVVIESDDGSGGLANYFRADGSTGDAILYHYGAQRLHTTSTGINVVGTITADGLDIDDSANIKLGTGDDLRLYHNGTNSYIENYTGNLYIFNASNDRDIHLQTDDGSGGITNYVFCDGSEGSVTLSHLGNTRIQTTNTGASVTGNLNISGHTYLNDNRELVIGAGNDLKLYHNATDSYIDNATGDFYIRANGDDMILRAADNISIMPQNGENGINVYGDGPVDLYYNNDHKFQTTATGAKVLGALEVTQEYPSIRPTLDLNFAATKRLDRRITFTRDSVGTYVDENGLVKYASNNVPRFNHNPTTHESLGLLVEETRTNLLNYSDLISGYSGSWWRNGGTTVSKGSDVTAPDGTVSAWNTVYNGTSGDGNVVRQAGEVTTSNSTVYTLSVFAKIPSTNTYIQGVRIRTYNSNHSAQFNLSTGTISTTEGTTTNRMEAYPNDWYRCSITFTSGTDGNQGIQFYLGNDTNTLLNDASANGEALYLWGAQLEASAFPTSYIPTGSSTVTRDDDDAVIKGTNFSDIYNETEGTIFAEFNTKVNTGTTSKWAVSLRDPANNNNYIAVKTYAANIQVLQVQTGGSSAASLSVNNSVVIDQFRRVAGSFKVNDFDAADGGTLLTGDTSGAMPTGITQMDIGRGWSNSDQKLEGHIKSIKYYRTKLPDAQLQGLTQQ